MTKDQATEHGEVIRWWTENSDKGVWHYVAGWYIEYNPAFLCNVKYVQNDEYAELRKALIDGKTIQAKPYSIDGSSTYTDLIFTKEEPIEALCIGDLRIKPDEPTFKLDDWVIEYYTLLLNGEYIPKTKLHQVTIAEYDVIVCGASEFRVLQDNIKLWEPVEGEWIIAWQDNWVDNYQIKRYHSAISYSNIAPLEFIQTLKGIL